MWRGGVGAAYRLPALSSAGASLASPCFRFHIALIEPDVRICRIRLSEKTHTRPTPVSEESRGRLFSGVATWPEELRGERATEENQQRRRPGFENDDGAGRGLD